MIITSPIRSKAPCKGPPVAVSSGSSNRAHVTASDPTLQPHPAALGWREDMIRRAAYLRSLQRNCAPGKELEDWLAAEREIDELLACGAAPYC